LFIKAGAAVDVAGVTEQAFQIADANGLALPGGLAVGVPTKIGEIPMVITSAGVSEINVVSKPGQPNMNVEFTDFMPSIGAASPLPIKLSKFDASPVVGIKASDLKWTSVSEINASHYEIERSVDGINFEFVGQKPAQGNSNWAIDYNFIDDKLPNTRTGEEIYYYRLQMIDLDGQTEYSEIRSVRFSNTDAISIKMGPNPTSDILNINMSATEEDDTEAPMNVYDITGKLVMRKMVSTNGITQIDMSDFANGLYNVAITHKNKVHNNQVIKSN
jgi:hypothetical protein